MSYTNKGLKDWIKKVPKSKPAPVQLKQAQPAQPATAAFQAKARYEETSKGLVGMVNAHLAGPIRYAKAFKQAKAAEGGTLPSIRGPLVRLMRDSYLKYGELQGVDARGNKYYRNDDYAMGRNRWVVYAEKNFEQRYNYDASDVPAEWHRWLHYMTDDPPTDAGVPPIERKFITEHVRNNTGTVKQYVPYTTTRKKVESWDPNE